VASSALDEGGCSLGKIWDLFERFRMEGFNSLRRDRLFSIMNERASLIIETVEVIFHANISSVLLGAELLVRLVCFEFLGVRHERLDSSRIQAFVPCCGSLFEALLEFFGALMMSLIMERDGISSLGRFAVTRRNSGRFTNKVQFKTAACAAKKFRQATSTSTVSSQTRQD
jgi:hypothetical protein